MNKKLLTFIIGLLMGIFIAITAPVTLDSVLSIKGTSDPEQPLSDRDSADRYTNKAPSAPTLMEDIDLPISTGSDDSAISDDENENEDYTPPSVTSSPSGDDANIEPGIMPNNTQSSENEVLKIMQTSPKKNDPFSFALSADGVMPVRISENTLKVNVTYGGGCAEHDFTLLWDGVFLESYPVQAYLTLVHKDNDDVCDALVYETLEFDLTLLKDMYTQAYQTTSGTVMLHVKGTEQNSQSIGYTF